MRKCLYDLLKLLRNSNVLRFVFKKNQVFFFWFGLRNKIDEEHVALIFTMNLLTACIIKPKKI